MSENAIAVKYVLFTHYRRNEDADFKTYSNDPRKDVAKLDDVQYLIRHFRGLKELLTSPGHEGMLVIFYDPGYTHFLNDLAEREDDPDEKPIYREPGLDFAEKVSAHLQEQLRAHGLAERVRFLTSHDLKVVLGRVNKLAADQFATFFIGHATGLRYDAPKVVEAILRLRLLGRGVPVFRLDHDVLFTETNHAIPDLGLFKAVECASHAHRLRIQQPAISTFLFSASYNTRALLEPHASDEERFDAWSRAFATRIFPALLADPEKIAGIYEAGRAQHKELWKRYQEESLDPDLACLYYGLEPIQGRVAPDGANGMTAVGAHPLHAVISGALLCLSDSAILDLPPFSNFSLSVMWIDDHLKYSLHRAMRHFTTGDPIELEPGLSEARLDEVMVVKARAEIDNLPRYVFQMYLPTLLCGTIMDAWITTTPYVKCRRASLHSQEEIEAWTTAREDETDALLPRAMITALSEGGLKTQARRKLARDLRKEAAKRIEEVRRRWLDLRKGEARTFASYWAAGDVGDHFHERFFDSKDKLWPGIPDKALGDDPITEVEHLSQYLRTMVEQLVDDTIEYIEWTLEWPKFIQIVRSIHQGEFVGDIGWRPR